MQRVKVVDSHTGGEPTRVVIDGGPDLGWGPLAERRERFEEQSDDFRRAIVNEPRGADWMVGALLCKPFDPKCDAAVIFFNNVGYLGMCGHGMMGLAVVLAHLGRISPGRHHIETVVGVVAVDLLDQHTVAIENVASYRHARSVPLELSGGDTIHGDIAWGGNWFYLVHDHGQPISFSRVDALTDMTWRIRQALHRQGITGANGSEIDHIELFGPSTDPNLNSKNFVLCPGKAYDRSPCGTGTSAKLACLVADNTFGEGDLWRQESITGSVFEGSVKIKDGRIIPRIQGTAYITAESTILLDSSDPFSNGIQRS